jgi:hypothetical protein
MTNRLFLVNMTFLLRVQPGTCLLPNAGTLNDWVKPLETIQKTPTTQFMYLAARDLPVDFRGFLERHAELWRRIPAWTLRLLMPRHLTQAIPTYEAAVREQLAMPLAPDVVEEFRWYVHARKTESGMAQERLDQAVRAFGAPGFQAMYRAWRHRGEMASTPCPSTPSRTTWRGTGRWESRGAPHA